MDYLPNNFSPDRSAIEAAWRKAMIRRHTPSEIAWALPLGHAATVVSDAAFEEMLSRIQPQLRMVPIDLADIDCRALYLPTIRNFVVIPASAVHGAEIGAVIRGNATPRNGQSDD